MKGFGVCACVVFDVGILCILDGVHLAFACNMYDRGEVQRVEYQIVLFPSASVIRF